jgi:hypothetical protein
MSACRHFSENKNGEILLELFKRQQFFGCDIKVRSEMSARRQIPVTFTTKVLLEVSAQGMLGLFFNGLGAKGSPRIRSEKRSHNFPPCVQRLTNFMAIANHK